MPLGGVDPRRVADAVERLRLRELPVDECDGVTPGREHAREVLRRRRRRVEDVRYSVRNQNPFHLEGIFAIILSSVGQGPG